MRYTFFASLLLAIGNLLSYAQTTSISAGSYDVPETVIDSLYNGWDDERFDRYNDSLISALYPDVVPCKLSDEELNNYKSPQKMPAAGGSRLISIVPTSIDINKSKSVGQIPIKSGTSSHGAKTYSIPFDLCEGMHGLTPKLSLNYSSHHGNSSLGMGWSLSGLPRISRASKNIYFDGKTIGLQMTKDDAFVLDGSRLIKLSSSSEFNLYETEQGNIKAKGYIQSNDIRYFEVFYPDGHRAILGNPSGTSEIYYPITSLSDLYGNTISYSYDWGNFHRITKISYNGASIDFKYIDRQDPILIYIGGRKIEETKLLNEIEFKFGSQSLGKYSLSYKVQNNKSLLSEIGYSAGGNSFNPVKCYYGTGTTELGYGESPTQLLEWYVSPNPEMIKVVKGKFDYDDGADGLIVCPNLNPYWRRYQPGTATTHSKKRYNNLYQGDEKIFLYAGLKSSLASPMPNLLTEEGFIDIFCADLDGQQEEYVIKVNNNVIDGKDRVTFKVYRANVLNGMSLLYTRNFDFNTIYTDKRNYKSSQPKFYHTGDFNGDGKMEVLAISEHEPFDDTDLPSKCYIFDLAGNKLLYSGHLCNYSIQLIGDENYDPKSTANNSDKFLVMDYNGDGKTDICHINKNGTDIYTFDISGSIMTPQKVATYTGLKLSDLENRRLLLGEFNGDGLIDLLVSPPEGKEMTWYIYNSTGNGQFESVSFSGDMNSTDDKCYFGFVTQDINGDGLTDLIKYYDDMFWTRLAKNNNFNGGNFRVYHALADTNSIIVPVNICSRNSFSQLLTLKNGTVKKYSCERDDATEQLMTGMANSLGIIERNSYSKINQVGISENIYERGYDAIFPYVNIQEPISVLISVETYLNGDIIDNNKFEYFNAVMHRQGRGFCGFEEIVRYDNRDRRNSTVYSPYNRSLITKETYPGAEKSYTYDVNIAANKIAKINMSGLTEKNLLKGTSATSSYEYDQYGYPTKETTAYSDGTMRTITSRYLNSTDLSGSNGYSLGFMVEQDRTTTIGSSTYSEKLWMPAVSKRQPYVKLRLINGKQTEEAIQQYDSFGNATSSSVKLYSSTNSLLTKYEYDTYGRVLKVTDPKGLTNEYSYDSNGRISTHTNHYGGITTFDYDSFGREVSTGYPDGTTKTVSYSWVSGNSDNRLYSIKTEETGKAAETIYYDAQNREVRRSREMFINDYCPDGISSIDTEYDANGNISRSSLPFSESYGSILWKNYEYDDYDRTVSIIEDLDATDAQITIMGNRAISYSYSGNNVTSTEKNITSVRKYDTQNNLISVTDPGGTVTYNIEADGQPASIEISGGATINLTYDDYRRRLSLDDPGHGITTYEYDASGNLSKEIDAAGNEKTYTYDKFNRLIKKSLPEFTTTYTYDSSDNLTEVTSTNGTSKSFAYDSIGRILSEKETVETKWLKKEYSYSDGNISSIKYTSQSGVLATETRTYERGCLSKVTLDDGKEIYRLRRMMPNGRISRYNICEIDNQQEYKSDGTPYSQLSYLPRDNNRWAQVNTSSLIFNPANDNLIARAVPGCPELEMFEYDGLNRLISCYKDTLAYDESGNIIKRSSIGEFSYTHPDNPFAVTEAAPVDGAIDNPAADISYYSFMRPKQLDSDGKRMKFKYNAGYDRVKSEYSIDDRNRFTRYYLGGCYEYDSIGAVVEKLYLNGGYYGSSVVLAKIPTIGRKAFSYILRDYLGSVTYLLDSNYNVAEQYSYDAWGQLRDISTLEPIEAPDYNAIGRGYCGHEYIPGFGLINMNARLYDPALGRFLSPDPYVQFPDFTQSFNRYTYGLNNPMLYVDENGEFVHIIIGAVVGGIFNLATKVYLGQVNDFWDGLAAFGIGALAGGIGGATGYSVCVATESAIGGIGGFAAGAVGGAAGAFISTPVENVGNNLYFGDPLLSFEEYATGIASGAISGGLTNGTIASLNGRNFFTGKGKLPPLTSEELAALNQGIASESDLALIPGGKYTIYRGYDPLTKETKYIGMTGRKFQDRVNEHLRSKTPRAKLEYEIIGYANTKLQARILEQQNINKYGLENLLNKRNEISPLYWWKYGIK